MQENAKTPSFCLITPADIDKFVSLSRSTFYDAFAFCNNPLDMDLYMEENMVHEPLLTELKDADNLFMFCKLDDAIVGYFKLRLALNEEAPEGKKCIELCRLYVSKEFQNKGLGQMMLNYCIEFAKKHDYDCMWLGVWEHNEGALRLYSRNGFERYGSHNFILGNDVQTDYLMAKKLK